jgi:hypothetical protein
VTKTTPESKTRDACGRHQAAGGRQGIVLSGPVELAPSDSSASAGSPSIATDFNPLHSSKVDDQAVVTGCAAGNVMATTPDCDWQLHLAGECDGCCHVIGAYASGDSSRPPVDHPVPNSPGRIIFGVIGGYDLARNLGGELVNVAGCRGAQRALRSVL